MIIHQQERKRVKVGVSGVERGLYFSIRRGKMDNCPDLLVTKARWKHDGKQYKLTYCLSTECEFPAKLCIYKYQCEIKRSKIYEGMMQ